VTCAVSLPLTAAVIAGCGEEGTRSPDNTDVSMLQGADSQGCTVDYGPLNQLRCHIRGKNSIFHRMILRFLSCPVTCMVSIVADGVPVPTGAFECGPESLDQARSCLVPSPRLLSETRVLVLLCDSILIIPTLLVLYAFSYCQRSVHTTADSGKAQRVMLTHYSPMRRWLPSVTQK